MIGLENNKIEDVIMAKSQDAKKTEKKKPQKTPKEKKAEKIKKKQEK
jgi:hypothetical protein